MVNTIDADEGTDGDSDFVAPDPEVAGKVRDFFGRAVPAAIVARKDLFDRVQGTLALHVDGAGCWKVSFGDHAADDALLEEATMDADCICVFSTASFARVLEGKQPEPSPFVMGEETLIEQFGQLFVPPAKGGLGARFIK
jgi:hypothetical protein